MTTRQPPGQPLLSDEERAVLEQACREFGVPPSLVESLIAAEARVFGMGRRHNLWTDLDALLREQAEGEGERDESGAEEEAE
jgi:hypothetical protein